MDSFSPRNSQDKNENIRQYNPYKDLSLYGNRPIQALYNLPTSPEFLFHEESLEKHRSITGGYSGIKAAEVGESLKLQLNRVLNSGGHTGRKYGNSSGCVGLIFTGLESLTMYMSGGKHNALNSVLAGLGTGTLYRAASEPRSAAIAGAIGGMTVGAAVVENARELQRKFLLFFFSAVETAVFIDGKLFNCTLN
ncbi:hypothetical protein M9H77_07686 [Catharanthus roseus]|uniref:Uncharacterized protein n=1 Tax=Catharanthus roseus TaxID=4058 RepID=A0ACC0BVX5_CATRO|nr:hypothetical protein M9H77_07686 [Catharanthus roseus]